MPKYCFILGSNPTLSKAEIFSFLENYGMQFNIVLQINEAFIIETNDKFEPNDIQPKLGGTIKIGEIIDEIQQTNLESTLKLDLLEKKYFNIIKNKIIFGFSIYGDNKWKFNRMLKNYGLKIKKQLISNGCKARFVTSRDNDLSSVIVKKNKLISQGADILIIINENKLYLGKTLTVQDFEDYSKRDYSRPKRDKRAGLIPPKLAQILINLAQVKKEQTILDPFCGSGTIIQEAIFAGYKNIIGSDISKKAIEEAKQNIDWLFKEYPKLNRDNFNLKLFCSDARKINEHFINKQIDAVITEPHLGPVYEKSPQLEEIKLVAKELSDLYIQSLHNFLKIIKPEARIVIIFPCWKLNEGIFNLSILDKIEKLGFKIKKFDLIKTTDRGSIIYSRPDQIVLREIFIFLK